MKHDSKPKYSSISHSNALLLSIFATAFVFFGRFGYDVGVGDQDEFLPFLTHLLHGQLLGNDWFVGTQLSSFSIRLPLVIVLKPLATVVGTPVAVLLIYVAAFVLSVVAAHLLVVRLFGSDPVAVLSTVIGLGITRVWTLGGNDVLTTMLVPSMVAWAFALWGLLEVTRDRPGRAGLMCGLAILFQPLVGIQMTVLTFVIHIVLIFSDRTHFRREKPGIAGKIFLVFQIPLLAGLVGSPVLGSILAGLVSDPLSGVSMNIFTLFRAPHHFIPPLFNQNMMFRFLLIAFGGLLSFGLVHSKIIRKSRLVLLTILATTMLALGLAYLNADLFHIAFLTELQLFKVSVTSKFFLVTLIIGTISTALLPAVISEYLTGLVNRTWMWIITAVAFALVLFAAWTFTPLTERNLPARARASSPDAALYAWIRSNTPLDAVFAIPPDLSGFSYYAERAMYINFKAFPYHEKDIREWYRRILLVAPLSGASSSNGRVTLPGVGGSSALEAMSSSYELATAEQLDDFARQEHVGYILRRRPLAPSTAPKKMVEVYQNQSWHLYKL